MRRATLIVSVIAAMLVSAVAGAAVTARFSDVPEDHWAVDSIEWAADAGIMRERGEGMFEPNRAVTRAHLAQILARYDRFHNSSGLSIDESDLLWDIVGPGDLNEDGDTDDKWEATTLEFDRAYSFYDLTVMVRDLCRTMGDTPARATLAETVQVIPDWLESFDWKGAVTDVDRWRVVFYGHWALCPEYDAIYDAWADADWPGIDS